MALNNTTRRSIWRGGLAVGLCVLGLAVYLFVSGSDLFPQDDYRVCGRTWIDVDGSGLQTGGDFGGDYNLGGVVVTLSGKDGFIQNTTTSVNSGNYFFDKLPEGEYELRFAGVDGFVHTVSAGKLWEKGPRLSVVDEETGKSSKFNLPTDRNTRRGDSCILRNVDAGYRSVASDGKISPLPDLLTVNGEVGVDASIEVLAKASADQTFAVKINHTDVPGHVQVDNDNKIVLSSVTAPGSYQISYEKVDENGDVSPGDVRVSITGAAEADYSFCGRVFRDVNGNNLQDKEDAVLNGVSVSLYSESGQLARGPQITVKGGRYEFSALETGNYYVRFNLHNKGKEFVDAGAGDNAQWNSDVNSSGLTRLINIPDESNKGRKKSASCTINWIDAGVK